MFAGELTKLAVTFADVEKFFLKFGDLFEIICYTCIVGAKMVKIGRCLQELGS